MNLVYHKVYFFDRINKIYRISFCIPDLLPSFG